MAKIEITPEFLQKNYDKTVELVSTHVSSPRKEKILTMLDDLKDRYVIAPASSKKDHHSAFPGGLCYHNLHVLKWVGKFASVMCKDKYSMETLLVATMFHDLGKIGDLKEDYYIEQDSSWHKEKLGQLYKMNPNIQFMKVPHRALFIAQKYGIELTQEEYIAVLVSDGMHDETNKHYSMKEPDLAIIIHYSDCWATRLEQHDEIIL